MNAASALLSRAQQIFQNKPFQPHPLFTSGHAQTLAGYAWPRRLNRPAVADEDRLFEVAPHSRVLAHCRWQPNRSDQPTIVLWHGIEGSSSSVYMLAMANKAYSAGFNVLRVNLRNCGGTEHLTPTLYHGGLTDDLRSVVTELIEHDRLDKIFLVGFSLGGNMVLKIAGEYGDSAPKQIVAISAISPSVDLNASAQTIEVSSNWLYHSSFLGRLKKRITIKSQLYPDLYDIQDLNLVRSIRAFDDRFTSLAFGFDNAADYYQKASALRVMDNIRLPTLIIHAKDDPFIPFAPLLDPIVAQNSQILLVAPERGGHVAFISAKPLSPVEDRFWAENRAIEFCRMAMACGT